MSRAYITANNVIVVSGHGAVDYSVTYSKEFPTDRHDMDRVAQIVNAIGSQAFQNSVTPGLKRSFSVNSDNHTWIEVDKDEVGEDLNIALNELVCTLLAAQTAHRTGVTKNTNFSPPVRSSVSSTGTSTVGSARPNSSSGALTKKSPSTVHQASPTQEPQGRSEVQGNPDMITVKDASEYEREINDSENSSKKTKDKPKIACRNDTTAMGKVDPELVEVNTDCVEDEEVSEFEPVILSRGEESSKPKTAFQRSKAMETSSEDEIEVNRDCCIVEKFKPKVRFQLMAEPLPQNEETKNDQS